MRNLRVRLQSHDQSKESRFNYYMIKALLDVKSIKIKRSISLHYHDQRHHRNYRRKLRKVFRQESKNSLNY